jgi:hypothetical protein
MTMVVTFFSLFTAVPCLSQQVLVLENVVSMKNLKYFEGDNISLRLSGKEDKTMDVLVNMTDSSMVLEVSGEVALSTIRAVYRERWLIQRLSALFMIGGVAYFGIDSFNRLINQEWPMVDNQTLMISTGLVGIGFLILPLKYRRINVGEKWKFKVLDLSSF